MDWSLNVPASRNGKRQACDPCRRRKLACDHGLPICKRCRQSRVPQNCTYLNKRQDTADSPSSVSASVRPGSVKFTATARVRARETKRAAKTGYLGATSVPQLLREPQDDLQSSFPIDSEARDEASLQGEEPAETRPAEGIDQAKLGNALQVLDCIPDPDVARALLSHSARIVEAWLRPTIYHLCDSLYDCFQPQVARPVRRHRLKLLAQVLFDNAERPLVEDEEDDSRTWLASFTDRNFRWEALGILFMHWALGRRGLRREGKSAGRVRRSRRRRKVTLIAQSHVWTFAGRIRPRILCWRTCS